MAEQIQSLRQVAMITRDVEESLRFWTAAFDLEECFRDDLSRFGLRNVVIPIGDTFLELLGVDRPDSQTWSDLMRRLLKSLEAPDAHPGAPTPRPTRRRAK